MNYVYLCVKTEADNMVFSGLAVEHPFLGLLKLSEAKSGDTMNVPSLFQKIADEEIGEVGGLLKEKGITPTQMWALDQSTSPMLLSAKF